MSTQKFSSNASTFAQKYSKLSGTGISKQQITFSYQNGTSKEKEIKGKPGEYKTIFSVRKATRDEKGIVPVKKLSINWQQSESGQELLLIKDGSVVATFATLITKEIAFNPYPIWDEPEVAISIPTLTSFSAIESISVGNFFTQWIISPQFFEHISILSERGTYTPQLVKMVLLLIPYLAARDKVVTENQEIDVYTQDIVIDQEWLIADYLDNIALLTKNAKMRKLFRNANSVLELAPESENPLQPMTEIITSDTTEDDSSILTVDEINQAEESAIEVTAE
jgi:hypothetical protein